VEAPAGFWSDYERVQLAGGPIVLRVSTLVTRVSSTAAALAGCATLVTGSIALGLLRVGLPAQTPAAAASLVARLHADVGQADGSVIVERAPREVREAVDPWGPVADGALDLMRALKTEFDPRGVLNPGRFVGGL
jgi:glycolate oxidase FAD binding subunit